jgi:zinc-ribbon domain
MPDVTVLFIGETILLIGIVVTILTLILLYSLGILGFPDIKPEQILKHIKANMNRLRLFIVGGIWQMKFLIARKSGVSSNSQLARLPEGIEVIKKNTTRPLAMLHTSCPKCGNFVRFSAAFCSNCGIPLTPSRPMPKPIINWQPYTLEPVSDKLPALPVTGELDEEVSEIVHIDLMLKVKLYLLWDRAGR